MAVFLWQFLRNPRRIGAVAPSSAYLARKMMEPIDFEKAQCIVEYGPGTGSFTRELVRRKRPDTALLLIEQNAAFCRQLRERFGQAPGVTIVEGSAADAAAHLAAQGLGPVDYIVSGLPFTSLPAPVSDAILDQTRQVIGARGRFITFQYSMAKKKLFQRFFPHMDHRLALWNLPPAYVLVLGA